MKKCGYVPGGSIRVGAPLFMDSVSIFRKKCTSPVVYQNPVHKPTSVCFLALRLLEETSLVTANQYQPLSSPELAHVVLDPQEDSEPSLSKTFVLDNSRLQLEPIKQTFGLITVEIILGAYGDLEGAAYQLPVLIDNLPPPPPPWCFPQLHAYFLTFKTL